MLDRMFSRALITNDGTDWCVAAEATTPWAVKRRGRHLEEKPMTTRSLANAEGERITAHRKRKAGSRTAAEASLKTKKRNQHPRQQQTSRR